MASNLEPKINRIATAVTSALSALTAKGVTVPEGANVESLAALIEGIEAGGGGGEVTYGTITPADMQADTLVIEHGLGVKPAFVLICAKDDENQVYSRSSPYGQSFIYAIEDLNYALSNFYYSKYQNSDSVYYNSGVVKDSIGSDLNYYIALSDTSIIWAKRNTSYGFGRKQSSFFWVAVKEI